MLDLLLAGSDGGRTGLAEHLPLPPTWYPIRWLSSAGRLRPLRPVSFQGLGMQSLLVLPLGAAPPPASPLWPGERPYFFRTPLKSQQTDSCGSEWWSRGQ